MLTDWFMWMRRIASASKGAAERTVILSSIRSGAMGIVFVTMTSRISSRPRPPCPPPPPPAPPLEDDGERKVEAVGQLLAAAHRPVVRGDDHAVLQVLLAQVVGEERERPEAGTRGVGEA